MFREFLLLFFLLVRAFDLEYKNTSVNLIIFHFNIRGKLYIIQSDRNKHYKYL